MLVTYHAVTYLYRPFVLNSLLDSTHDLVVCLAVCVHLTLSSMAKFTKPSRDMLKHMRVAPFAAPIALVMVR